MTTLRCPTSSGPPSENPSLCHDTAPFTASSRVGPRRDHLDRPPLRTLLASAPEGTTTAAPARDDGPGSEEPDPPDAERSTFDRTRTPPTRSELQQARRETPDDRSRNCGPTPTLPEQRELGGTPRGEKRSALCETIGSKDPLAQQATAAPTGFRGIPSTASNADLARSGTRHSQEAPHEAPPAGHESDPGQPTSNEHAPSQ